MVVLMENLFKKYTLLSILVIYPISLMGTDSIEGRWIIPLYEGDPGNTMYEFLDGLRYTYYCVDENGCDSTYWNSLDTSDALPTINPYSVDDSTLSIDLHFGNIATYTMDFRCDGEVVDFYYDDDDNWEGLHSTMFRVGYDIDDCENQETIVFTKQDSADWTLSENQDRIADSVWITRKHNQSIFNIAQEEGYSGSDGSPLGTLWANGSTENTQNSDYTSFVTMHGGNPQTIINDTVSLYLPDYERYFDIVFLSFSGGNSGGGFSYSRKEVFPDHFSLGSIEGRWIIPLYEGDPGNTMYEFLDGLRYTYYCVDENGCDSTYWNSLDTSDALPTINPYTVDDSTLSIDLHFGNIATYTMDFRCDGEVVDFYYDDDDSWEGLHSTMFRVGYDVDDCVEQQLSIPSGISLPETFRLHQNYPNPFNPITNLKYELSDDAHVSIIIYDILGNIVNNLVYTNQSSGYKTVQWNGINNQGQSVSAGVYLYCIEADNFRQTRKMILLK